MRDDVERVELASKLDMERAEAVAHTSFFEE